MVPEGLGTALKPAHEVWWLAQKPLEGTYAANVARHGVGALAIDQCRVGVGERVQKGAGGWVNPGINGHDPVYQLGTGREYTTAGRWPPNVILTHDPNCVPVGTRRVKGHTIGSRGAGGQHGAYSPIGAGDGHQYTDADGLETVEAWQCVPGCPVAVLDGQSGVSVSTGGSGPASTEWRGDGHTVGAHMAGGTGGFGDSGGASRFYPTFRFEADDFAPFLYVAKAARSERDKGLRGHLPIVSAAEVTGRKEGSAGLSNPRASTTSAGRNSHPTVKPLALCRWLVRLITPPGETVLDPFLGSGSVGVAALMEGRGFIGIERESAYIAIARRRLVTTQPGLPLGAA